MNKLSLKKVVIVHCWEGYPDYCWYQDVKRKLENKEFEVLVPAFPETEEPKLNKWLPKLREAIGEPDENVFLIGHSVGGITIMRYLETLKEDEKVGGVVFVAGFTDDLGYDELKNFFTTSIDFAAIKNRGQRFVAIHSDNDPFVPLTHADIFRKRLGAKVKIISDAGHFSGPADDEESCNELPEAVESVISLSTK